MSKRDCPPDGGGPVASSGPLVPKLDAETISRGRRGAADLRHGGDGRRRAAATSPRFGRMVVTLTRLSEVMPSALTYASRFCQARRPCSTLSSGIVPSILWPTCPLIYSVRWRLRLRSHLCRRRWEGRVGALRSRRCIGLSLFVWLQTGGRWKLHSPFCRGQHGRGSEGIVTAWGEGQWTRSALYRAGQPSQTLALSICGDDRAGSITERIGALTTHSFAPSAYVATGRRHPILPDQREMIRQGALGRLQTAQGTRSQPARRLVRTDPERTSMSTS
jgi:hypothetical protein